MTSDLLKGWLSSSMLACDNWWIGTRFELWYALRIAFDEVMVPILAWLSQYFNSTLKNVFRSFKVFFVTL